MAALLLDENVPHSAAGALAAAGHDVAFVADIAPAVDDRGVLAFACSLNRVLVTFDGDFGDLLFKERVPAPPAVLYLRMHPIDGFVAGALAVRALAEPVDGHFIVCTTDALRRRPLPTVVDERP